jgi:quercetin dioxygenase-like cupin family protein
MRRILFLFLLTPVLQINAQEAVAVSKEPMHKNVFENEYLRVLDVRISPGDTTQFHKHETPSVFISLHPVRTGSQVIIEDGSATVLSLDRRITFESFYKSPRIHRVWNADTSVFHVMDVEVLSKGDKKIAAPIALPEFKELFDAPPVRTYRVTLKSNQAIEIKRNTAVLVVGLTDAGKVMVNSKSFLKEGDFLFIPPSEKINLVNKEQNEYSFALLELK